ncbi:Detected protein of confused Function [Hibiscus syriacus]|uniref:Detected protein of confused Function n=1 Tax=Hibiscus syriacus TaxID=106335 RepID=A0A6A2ZKW9_HIBSY|nr:Detected protein of confused Function [Hibiscus syriacus]
MDASLTKMSFIDGEQLNRLKKGWRSERLWKTKGPCSVDHSNLASLASKRQKADLSSPQRIEREVWRRHCRSAACFTIRKTDTASVLLEAMEYIQFLHEQVKIVEHYSLRNRGLCLVPISCTVGVARSNGADIWAPIKTTSPNLIKPSHNPASHFTVTGRLRNPVNRFSSPAPPSFMSVPERHAFDLFG